MTDATRTGGAQAQSKAQVRAGGLQAADGQAEAGTQSEAGARLREEHGAQVDALDAVLDDIESVLETNAEEYVNSFVQKGGQ